MDIKASQKKRENKIEEAIKIYDKVINHLLKNSPNENYKIARFYEKLAACYEQIKNFKKSAECYEKAAENYLRVGYRENAEMCRRLRKAPGERLLRLEL